ncbi:MAG: YdcF family protein [Pseudomonadota bacterium]
MELGALKPVLTSLVMPPLLLLLLSLLGLLLALKRRRTGLTLALLAISLLWLISCHGMAVWLSRTILPQFAPLAVSQLKISDVQAIVVLGGGVLPEAPEYGVAQLSANSTARLRYGVWLARQSAPANLPIAFAGGLGWTASNMQKESEAEVASRSALQDYGVQLRWAESESRDTISNARRMAPLLQREGIQRIVLVTEAWHMPRSVAAFEGAGLLVTPAPMAFMSPVQNRFIEWLPSGPGLQGSQQVLREWLALLAGRFMAV